MTRITISYTICKRKERRTLWVFASCDDALVNVITHSIFAVFQADLSSSDSDSDFEDAVDEAGDQEVKVEKFGLCCNLDEMIGKFKSQDPATMKSFFLMYWGLRR